MGQQVATKEKLMRVSVRELKDHLSEYLRKAEAGEEIVVVSGNRPVARILAPLAPEQPEDPAEAALRRLDAFTWVRPPQAPRERLPQPLDRTMPGEKRISDIVVEDRG